MSLVRLLTYTQYHTKGSASDYGMANALRATHNASAKPGRHGSVEILLLTDEQMRRYVSTALREVRYLDAAVRQEMEDSAYPPSAQGHLLRQCRICSSSTCQDKLVLPPQNPGGAETQLLSSELVPIRPFRVCAARACQLHLRTRKETSRASLASLALDQLDRAPVSHTRERAHLPSHDSMLHKAHHRTHTEAQMKIVTFASAEIAMFHR
jgi:hypothetical protein